MARHFEGNLPTRSWFGLGGLWCRPMPCSTALQRVPVRFTPFQRLAPDVSSRDRRGVSGADEIASECVAHLRETITGGRIRPTLTVFHPSAPHRPGPRIWNEQLTRYAGYQVGSGVVGDPRNLAFTERVHRLGWAGGR